jgi:uncharacterized repeat protein (TIGR03803 family)
MPPKVRFPFTTATTILAAILLAASSGLAGSKLKVLHSFGGSGDGAGLYGGLAFDPKGNLYGGTSGGGPGGYGVIYQLASQKDGTWKETTLRSFKVNDPDGYSVMGTFVTDKSGDVYGTLNGGGGAHTYGTVFELTPGAKGWTFTVIYRFGNNSGGAGSPKGPLIMDTAGNLYGTAYWPFELVRGGHGSWTFILLQNSGPGSNGGLARDPAGNLYGTTPHGGGGGCGAGCGTAYELHRDSKGNWNTSVLHDFGTGNDGMAFPNGTLAVDKHGNVYGAAGGGTYNDTALYELSPGPEPAGWKVTILHSFGGGRDGEGAITGPVFDKAGNMYGMTTGGGDSSCGVIYKMTRGPKASWTYTVLHSFTLSEGCTPEDRPTLDDKGNIYGTTIAGGAYWAGTAFEFTP